MGSLLKIIGIIYIITSVGALYAIVQTSANYTMVMETNLRFRIDLENLTIENRTQSPSLILSLVLSNPSHLDVEIFQSEFTIYLYNKSNDKNPHEPIAIYFSYSKISVKSNEVRTLTYIRDITQKKSLINYILNRWPDARIDFNIRFIYKIPKFPAWEQKEVYLATYQEQSNYGI